MLILAKFFFKEFDRTDPKDIGQLPPFAIEYIDKLSCHNRGAVFLTVLTERNGW